MDRAIKGPYNLGWVLLVEFFFYFMAAVIFVVAIDSNDLVGIIVLTSAFCVSAILSAVIYIRVKNQRRVLLQEILGNLGLENIDSLLLDYDDVVTVKSNSSLLKYDHIKYLKDGADFKQICAVVAMRKMVRNDLMSFLEKDEYADRPYYQYVKTLLYSYANFAIGYRVRVAYITYAGNYKTDKTFYFDEYKIEEIKRHPEYLMTKGQYSKLLKQQEKDKIDARKRYLYDQVNNVIDYANEHKDSMIVKSRVKKIDELVEELFYKTINSIQKISKLVSEEWGMLESRINSIYTEIIEIVKADKQIHEYYKSEDFARLKSTCNLLTESQKEFNVYIDEKARSITQLFGTRVVRNETQHDDVYNYVRAYKKSITPFTAEVSSGVFGSAENNPIKYILKYFYPNRGQYEIQIERLRVLIEELETLNDAKLIIDNYKKEYDQYIQEVPDYVLDNDESGFYSRLGLALVDESVLNIEYRFTYTSDGGMAQRSFTVPMTEENITELITQLQDKLSIEALSKEQRALMTTKLRNSIKIRDDYTCRMCGNSVHNEPNLLLEIDHIIPISKGGLTQENNLQTLCWKCNRNKGAKLI